ncbi:MAG TPA: methylmalonyl-CoA mutase family protein [Bacteroidota bacterium]|nr:methylmalonyl-CoA mutase family protein [Bacteroidota bacterium]
MSAPETTPQTSATESEWEQRRVQPVVARFGERKQGFRTDAGMVIDRLYSPEEFNYRERLGYPGEYPFTRGPYPTMYRSKYWTMRQYAGFGTAEESNSRYRYLLDSGTTGLSVAFDLPTQMGYDSDHTLAEGEVGKVGVAIDTLADMEVLFAGIPLQKVTTSMTINATAAILLSMYVALAKRQGADLTKLSGTIQNDILKEYSSRGTHIYPPAPSMRLVTDTFQWCSQNLPRWNAISISGYHIREAGATAVQELGFTLANGIAYVQAAVETGLSVDSFGPQLSFFFNAHNNFFEEVAKFRAARRLWARIMKDRFGAKNEESMKLRFHAQTGGSTLTAQQIDNNVVRVTLQALAAVLGGCQSLHTNSRDEALALPTESSVMLALRTQQVIAHESGVADTIDPLGGGYFVESLTDYLEREAWTLIGKIDEMGGAVRAIERKFYQNEIMKSAYEYQLAIEKKEKVIVGVNEFVIPTHEDPDLLTINASVAQRQAQRLREVKAKRDKETVRSTLEALKSAARTRQNLVPLILQSVEAYASVGEISDTLREVWGEYKE